MSKSDYAATIKNIFNKATAEANSSQQQQIEEIVEASQKHGENLKTAAEIYTSLGEVFSQTSKSILEAEAGVRKDANIVTVARLSSTLKAAEAMIKDIPIGTIIAGLGVIGYDMKKFAETAVDMQRQATAHCGCPACAQEAETSAPTEDAEGGVSVESADDVDTMLAHVPEEIRGIVKNLLNGDAASVRVVNLTGGTPPTKH